MGDISPRTGGRTTAAAATGLEVKDTTLLEVALSKGYYITISLLSKKYYTTIRPFK